MAIFKMSTDILGRLTSKPYQTKNADSKRNYRPDKDLIKSLHTHKHLKTNKSHRSLVVEHLCRP